MKYFLVFLSLLIVSCNNNDFDLKIVNQFGGFGRTNDYTHLGDFNFQIPNNLKISVNDFAGAIKTPLYIGGESFIIATGHGRIIKIDNDKINWIYEIKNKSNAVSGLATDKNGNIIFAADDNSVYSISNTGKLNWTFQVSEEGDSNSIFTFSEPLTTEKSILIATSKGFIFSLDLDGKLNWKFTSELAVSGVFSTDNKDKIFVGLSSNIFGSTDSVYVLDYKGNKISAVGYQNFRILSPVVYSEGCIYFCGAVEKNAGRM